LRLGILGGTFDPIHIGHLRMAIEICEDIKLEKVFVIPGAFPPHKNNKPVSPFSDRLKMSQLAVKDFSALESLDLEGRHQGLSYSIKTLKEIHRLYPHGLELFFIIGMDAFLEIKTWKNYRQLFYYTNFTIVKRTGSSNKELAPFIHSLDMGFIKKDSNTFINQSGTCLLYREALPLDISSTLIRERVAEERSIRFLVPESVRSYIYEKRLYKINGK